MTSNPGYDLIHGKNFPEANVSYPYSNEQPSVFPSAPPQAASGFAYPNQGDGLPTASDLLSENPPSTVTSGYNYTDLPSYEDIKTAPYLPPPAYDDIEKPADEQIFTEIAFISNNEAQDAVIECATSTCCYGSKAAREMSVSNLQSSVALHYGLESFTEKRKTVWKEEPYTGQCIANYGAAPHPWSIVVQPSALFVKQTVHMEVPNTAHIITCVRCRGIGTRLCHSCNGHGWSHCHSCNGSGRCGENNCSMCPGNGHKQCYICDGSGRNRCFSCQGMGRLKKYVQLIVKFKNNIDNHVHQETDLQFPSDLVVKATGATMFQQEYIRVQPLFGHPCPEMNQASQQLIQRHLAKFVDQRILMQRHYLRGVPITKCLGSWKEKKFDVWVYGDERHVYMPNYPQRCCWGCNII